MISKKFFIVLCLFLGFSSWSNARVYGPYDGEFDAESQTKTVSFQVTESQLICDGMEFMQFKSTSSLIRGYALIIDPSKIRMQAENSRWSNKLEKVSAMAQRKHALAAVNGGFYRPNRTFCANPAGTLKIGNIFYADQQFSRGVLAWNSDGNRVYVGRMKVNWHLTIDKKKYRVDRINQPRGDGEAIVYNAAFRTKTLTNYQGLEFVVSGGSVKKIVSKGGNAQIPSDGFVYSVHDKAGIDCSAIKLGSKAKLSHTLELLDAPSKEYEVTNQSFDYIVGAGPTVLMKGNATSFDQMDQELFSGKPLVKMNGETVGSYHDAERHRHWLIDKYHPRTAVGKRADNTLVFVIVDGRIPNYSRGVNLYELADILQQFGCNCGINLDGGGASILYLQGQTRNMLAGSDLDEEERINMKSGVGIERPVGNAILFFKQT